MNNIIKRTWNQGSMVNIEDLRGMTFQAESGGHTFVISAIDADGNAVSLSGTPAGTMLRPDNTDQALTCSISGGKVYATLPAGCYDVPGRAGITIFLTSGGQKAAIYAAVVSVTRTQSGTVAPGTTASVVDLINAINAAINSIPASYSSLLADIAPNYSNSALYSVGQYAWYDGDLKQCIMPITTAESYTAAHWTSAVLGQDVSDLKSALSGIVDPYNPNRGYEVGEYCISPDNIVERCFLAVTNPPKPYSGNVNWEEANLTEDLLAMINSQSLQNSYAEKMLANGIGSIPSVCVNGAVSAANGTLIVNAYKYRVSTWNLCEFTKNTTLYIKDGFVFNISLYNDDGSYAQTIQNQTIYTVLNGQKFRLTIKRTTESTSEIADLIEFYSAVYYYTDESRIIADRIIDEFFGGYIATNTNPVILTPVQTADYKCIEIDCSEGDGFKVTGSAGTTATLYAFLDSNNMVLDKTSVDLTIADLIIKAPSNTAKAVFNFRTNNVIGLEKISISDDIKNAEKRCYQQMTNDLLADKTFISGYIITNEGNIGESNIIITSDYIFVPKGKEITFKPYIRRFLAYQNINQPIKSTFASYNTGTEYSYTATDDCYVRVSIERAHFGLTSAVIGNRKLYASTIDSNNLLKFASIANAKNCIFSKVGDELTVETQNSDTWSCINILTNAFEGDAIYLFELDVKTASGTGKAIRMVFLGDESGTNATYGGTGTDVIADGDHLSAFGIARAGCRGIRLFITAGTEGTASFVFNKVAVYKVLDVDVPQEVKKTTYTVQKARVSFIDDDGDIQFYTKLLPMIRTYGIPIATAYQGDNGFERSDLFMTMEQLHEVEEAGGEIIAHGYNSLITLGDKAEANMVQCKRLLNAAGFFPNVYAYPYGDNDERIRALTEKYFDASFKGVYPYSPDYRTEKGCVPMYRLNRCHCGGNEYDVIAEEGRYANLDTASMEYFEALIQECITRKSWLVLYTHAWQMDNGQTPTGYATQEELMEAIIERILQLKAGGVDIDIIKVRDGVEMFGNAFQGGDYLGQENDNMELHSTKGVAVSKNGETDGFD